MVIYRYSTNGRHDDEEEEVKERTKARNADAFRASGVFFLIPFFCITKNHLQRVWNRNENHNSEWPPATATSTINTNTRDEEPGGLETQTRAPGIFFFFFLTLLIVIFK